MDIFAFIPALMILIVSVYTISGVFDKNEEFVWRIWKLIFSIILVLLTIYLTNRGIKEVRHNNSKSYIYYYNNNF